MRDADTEAAIVREVLAAHVPALETLRLTRGVLTQEQLRTLVRAEGLTAITCTGAARRAQRAVWFGALAGRAQEASLAALGITRIETAPKAKILVLDRVKILREERDAITVQSTTTGIRSIIPRAAWRADSYCDRNGNPLTAPDAPTWGRTAPWLEKVRLLRRVQAGAGGRAFAASKHEGERRAHIRNWALSNGSRLQTATKGALA
jgi:hypothetical protein